MVSIFKSLSRTYTSTINELKTVANGSDREALLIETKELLDELMDYLKSYDWLHKSTSKEKMKVYLESGFDYDVLCDTFDLSYDNAKMTVSWANGQFKKKIGENTIKLIREGFIDEARSAFYMNSGKINVSMLITSDGLECLPKSKFNIYSLKDCETELKILKLISKTTLQRYMDMMDKEKMAYLLWLLEGQSKKSDLFRPYLLALLNNNLTAEELVELENEIKSQQNYI